MGLMAVVGVAGVIWQLHDTPLLVALTAAAGMVGARLQRGPLLFVAALVGAGLFWSSLDPAERSLWHRGRVLHAKIVGDLPQVSWKKVLGSVTAPWYDHYRPPAGVADQIELLEEQTVNGVGVELFKTTLGEIWAPKPGRDVLAWIVWELTKQTDYESGDVKILPGDTVIDCGAHVGLFSKYALQRGAQRVIAIEPDPTNLSCLELNLAHELTAGKVVIVKAGVWDVKTRLILSAAEDRSATKSFVLELQEDIEGVPVMPLDEIVEDLELGKVDFIKMDIEGSERRALRGASRTLKRFKPRMAICSYHLPDDPLVITNTVLKASSDYRIHAKDLDLHGGHVSPKVLFFN